jgi:hypothetical protein
MALATPISKAKIWLRAHSRSCLEAWLAGMEAADGIAMMFGVHGRKEIGGGFVFGVGLASTPVHEETVAEPAQHAHHPHGFGPAHAALVIQVADVQPQMQAVLNAPSRPVVRQPLSGVELGGWQAGHQRDRLRFVLTQPSPQQGYLFDAGKIDCFRGGRARTQDPDFQLGFVKLDTAGQVPGGLSRGKNALAAQGPIFQCSLARSADCL